MTELTFLHLSDLHYRSPEHKDIGIVIDALLDDLQGLQDKVKKPDFVIFSGDLIFAGDLGYSKERNDYEEVKQTFINPLLKKLGLSSDFFFVCPGNHDIERAKVDGIKFQIIEKGLDATLVDRQAVNTFVDGTECDGDAFARLDNFETFRKSLANSFIHKDKRLYTTYIFNVGDKTVGIACINSAWRSYGGEADYGKLILGERVLDACIDDLSDCNLRIGVVHHPFSYLKGFERSALERRAYATFDFWLHGHMHEPDAKAILPIESNRIVDISAGALYHHRDWYNGYSLIYYSFDSNQGQVYLREYFDRGARRHFGPAQAYAGDNGIFPFQLQPIDTAISSSHTLMNQLRQSLGDLVSESVLAAITTSGIKRNLLDVFVEPPLASKPEFRPSSPEDDKNKAEDSKRDLIELLHSEENVVFVGRRESGKTTLLNYIYLLSLETRSLESHRVPILISFRDLPKGVDRLKKAIYSYFRDHHVEFSSQDINRNIEQGNYLFIVDDLDLSDTNAINQFKTFANTYSKNRYICTFEQVVSTSMSTIDSPPDLGMKYERVYIHSLKRKQIRTLIEKWFPQKTTNEIDELLKEVWLSVKSIRLPLTPLVISMVLFLVETKKELILTNQASLVENLVEFLLEKTGTAQSKVSAGLVGMDYRNLAHFLEYMARFMIETGGHLPVDEFEDKAQCYFKNRSRDATRGFIRNLIDYFIKRGVLVQDRERIWFRFNCFCEFFTAKYMIEDKDFYKNIVSQERCLDRIYVIDYYTQLTRNDASLLELFIDRVQLSFSDYQDKLGYSINLDMFDAPEFQSYKKQWHEEHVLQKTSDFEGDMELNDSDGKEIEWVDTEELNPSELSDVIADEMELAIKAHKALITVSEPVEIAQRTFLGNLSLLSLATKNCELLDDEQLKRRSLRLCVDAHMKHMCSMAIKEIKRVNAMSDEDIQKEILSNMRRVMTVFDLVNKTSPDIQPGDIAGVRKTLKEMTLNIYHLMNHAVLSALLNSSSLEVIQREEIETEENHLMVRFMLALLYADLHSRGYVEKLRRICRETVHNDFIQDVLQIELIHYYMLEQGRDERNALEDIIAEVVSRQQGLPVHAKSTVIAQLRKQWLSSDHSEY